MEHQRSAVESENFLIKAKITDLINNITRMSKQPTIESDLSQVLDEFLEKLGECDKYLQNGIFNMNFAEAALLVQSSADLYSKKVDLLWDVIFDYQKRLLLSEEQNGDKEQELEKVEERKRKYKRKRKTNLDESERVKLVNNFSFGQVDSFDYLNQDYDTTDLFKEWSKFELRKENDDLREHMANKKFSFLSNDRIYTEDNDYVGRYDQFHSTSLLQEMFHLEEQKLLADDSNCVTNMRIDTYVINDFLLENSIPTTSSKDFYITELNKYISNFLHSHKHPEKESHLSDDVLKQLHCKRSVVCLERLPANILKEKIRRASLADSLFGDDMSTTSENCPSPCNFIKDNGCGVNETFDQIGGSLENRSKSCSQDSAFYEDEMNNEEGEADIGASIDGAIDVVTVDVSTALESTAADEIIDPNPISLEPVTTEVSASSIVTTATDFLSTTSEPTTNKLPETTKTTLLDASELEASVEIDILETLNFEENASTVVTRHKIGRKWSLNLENSEDNEEYTIKKRKVQKKKISEKILKRWATGVSCKYKDFEIFCRLHYKAADGEGTVQAYVPDIENSNEDEDPGQISEEEPEENEVQSLPNTDEETSDLEETHEETTPENDTCEDQDMTLSQPTDTPNLPAISPIPALNVPSCSTLKDTELITSTPFHSRIQLNSVLGLSDTDLEQDKLCRKNVRDWRSFIMPKISSMEKADFDIHEYGSRIIEPSEIGEERHFKDIVEGKNAAEVARFFIATLQLANTYNVEIAGAVPGEIANDSFKIKTLSKTKHHELLEDYQAPSEETFRERLERVKALNPKVPLHSTSRRGPPPTKKPKFTVLSINNLL